MPPQILRDYQERGLRDVLTAWRGGARSVLAVSPTGSGKTTLFATLAAQLAGGGRRVVILVHRRELATQASNRLREFGVPFGFVMAGEQPVPYAPVQIASVQTLIRRRPPPADLVICDEAHLSTAHTWQTVLESYPRARILGVTATPWRLTGKPLAGAYDASTVVATPRELREQGHLSSYVGFSYKTPDLSAVKTTGGDYNERETAALMSNSLIVDNVVEMYGKHAAGLSGVVFAVTVDHSLGLTQKFRAAGIPAEHLDGQTPIDTRRAILRRVESGATRVLCNVGVAVEGLDIPRLKCCVLARPTKSLARAIQMMGRVRRPWEGVTARIHDHAFVIKAHGLPDDDRDYSLEAQKEKPPSLTTCSECMALYSGPSCPACGAEREPVPVGDREIATVPDAEQFEFSSAESTPADPPPEAMPPVRVQWNTPGRKLEGVLVRRWEEKTAYGALPTYELRGEKRLYHFHGPTMLAALLRQIPDSSTVRITYLHEERLSSNRHRKVFKLEVDDGEPEEEPRRSLPGGGAPDSQDT